MAVDDVIARGAGSERGMPTLLSGLMKFLRAIKPFDLFFLAVLVLIWSAG